ncbi:MAG: hypothetical protein HOV96_28965, partial [Nonomuraea sp.]|nr:hypothetical protein [Nonomuraea sp.]
VVDAAPPGVEAAAKGGFGLIVAVTRNEPGSPTALTEPTGVTAATGRGADGQDGVDGVDGQDGVAELARRGAQVVVEDLGELTVRGRVLPLRA